MFYLSEAKDESDRCWKVATETYDRAAALSIIRRKLGRSARADITNIIDELKDVSSLLRDCTDLLLVFKSRIDLVHAYLATLLQSINHTNRALWVFLGDRDLSYDKAAESKWDFFLMKMHKEAGVTLLTRITIYKCFLTELVNLWQRPSMLEPVNFAQKIDKVVKLLETQNIAAPSILPPIPKGSAIKIVQHIWSQKLFPYRKKMIKLKQDSPLSQCFGRSSLRAANEIPADANILYRLPFNGNELSVVVYLDPEEKDLTRMWCRWKGTKDEGFKSKFASRGLHELRVERQGSSLVFEGYNDSKREPEEWLVLYFKHWEEMVLLHDSFAALKQCHPDKVECDPRELILGGEKKLFKGRIIDDYQRLDFCITMYEDRNCGGARIASTVCRTELKRSPVWTAFHVGSHELKKDNAIRKSDHTVVLSNLDKVVTSPGYDEKSQMVGKRAFSIRFQEKFDADDFMKAWKKLVKEYDAN